MLHRRGFLLNTTRGAALGAWVLGGVAWGLCAPAHAQPRYTVPVEQLQEMVAQKFARKVPVSGLVDLTLHTPRLALRPEVNRLHATLVVDAAGPALRRSHAGTFEVEFALRYEPSDRTLRAYQLKLGRLDFPTMQPAVTELLNAYAPALADQSLREVTLHQLRPQDLAVFDGLGLQPGPITVTAKGLNVAFVTKPL